MKVKVLYAIAAIFAIAIFNINAQTVERNGEPALLSVDYEFVHVRDTTNRENPLKVNVRLYLGKESSLYVNQTIAEMREKMEVRMKEMGISVNGMASGMTVSIGGGSQAGTEELLITPKSKKMVQIDNIGQTIYEIQQDFPSLDWNITEETKEIGGYHVQQAKATYKGRDYVAWFAPDLPFSYGPWKFNGLPGLILEVSDVENEVQFLFKDLAQLEDEAVKIGVPENAVKANATQFARAKEASGNGPTISFSSGNPAPAGATTVRETQVVTINSDGVRRTLSGADATAEMERMKLQQANSNNNPIERETKKKK